MMHPPCGGAERDSLCGSTTHQLEPACPPSHICRKSGRSHSTKTLKGAELAGDFTRRLVMLEEQKSLPWTAVWDYYCAKKGVPVGGAWFDEVRAYEKQVLSKR
jgi:hypothetical protein